MLKDELLRSMRTRKFWHICEVCGKREFITTDEAHEAGWDYPPNMGTFGVLSPRTCCDCGITETLWFKIMNNKDKEIKRSNLSGQEQETLLRILGKPETLL